MIKLKSRTALLITIFHFLPLITDCTSALCNQTCGGKHLSYPFGFSAGCPIRLNCSRQGQIFVNEFPVQNVDQGNIQLSVEARCNRPFQAFKNLFTKNYAPKSNNAILLSNCSSKDLPCNVPLINVTTRFESLNCKNSNVSCFSNVTDENSFFQKSSMAQISKCRYVLSSILAGTPNNGSGLSLDVLVMELGWWLRGDCRCSEQASCVNVSAPDGPGFRCQCADGFDGDGYLDGVGCQKASQDCSPAKYLTGSGQCTGPVRIILLSGVFVVGATLVIVLGLICCCIQRLSTSKARRYTKRLAEAAGINIPIYSYKEIEKATNNFCDKQRLGTGAYGTVYAGKLHNENWVAIKRVKNRDTESIEQVINEIKLISSVSHPNLVRLLGCSIENGVQILVYEFMPNGTLCEHLQRERGAGLAWMVRLTIAGETAQAIAHLHSAIDPPIYHRDIKSSNILLDYNFRSKVADFGLSRLGRAEISHISTAPQGTPGYLDPQYQQNFHLSDKSDVYSFGVLLVEIITALKVVDFSRHPNEVNLAALATDRIAKAKLDEIIDPFLEPHIDAWTLSSVHKVAELAFRCLAFDRDMRPSMVEVAAELEQIMLSKCSSSDEMNCTSSLEILSCPFPDVSEKHLSLNEKRGELERIGLLKPEIETRRVKSMEKRKYNSPVSVQDPWLSEQSSDSKSSFLNQVI